MAPGDTVQVAADTLHAAMPQATVPHAVASHAAAHGGAAAGAEHGGGNVFAELLHHVQDSRELETPFGPIHLPQFAPFHVGGITIDMSITKHVVFLWAAAVLIVVLAIWVTRRNVKRPVPRGFGNVFEVMVVFIRDEMALPNMGPGGLKYMPYLLTTFFFILTMNLIGLFPYGAIGHRERQRHRRAGDHRVRDDPGLGDPGAGDRALSRTPHGRRPLGALADHGPDRDPRALHETVRPLHPSLCEHDRGTRGHRVPHRIDLPLPIVYHRRRAGRFRRSASYFLELFVAFLQAYIFTMLTSLFMGLGMQAAEHGAEDGHGH